MKRNILSILCIAFLSVLILSPVVFAYPMIGSTVVFGNGPGTTQGGEFTMSGFSNTFCVENGNPAEYLAFGIPFMVNAYETPSDGAAYLYYHFAIGDLAGYDYGVGRAASADALQAAIWQFQNQNGGAMNSFYDTVTNATPDQISEALAHVKILDMKWGANYGSYEIGDDAQDVLGVVPEPTTMLLLGLGLLGVAGIRRFKK